MTPTVLQDVLNRKLAHAELAGKSTQRDRGYGSGVSTLIACAYLTYLFLGQFAVWMLLTNNVWRPCDASGVKSLLRDRIVDVVSLRADEQVRRTYALRVVTTVADDLIGSERSMFALEDVAVRGYRAVVRPERAVALVRQTTYPNPAFVTSTFSDVTPEARQWIGQWLGLSCVDACRHDVVSIAQGLKG